MVVPRTPASNGSIIQPKCIISEGTTFNDSVRTILHIPTVYSRQSFVRGFSETHPSQVHVICGTLSRRDRERREMCKAQSRLLTKPSLSKTRIGEDSHFGGIYERSKFI